MFSLHLNPLSVPHHRLNFLHIEQEGFHRLVNPEPLKIRPDFGPLINQGSLWPVSPVSKWIKEGIFSSSGRVFFLAPRVVVIEAIVEVAVFTIVIVLLYLVCKYTNKI